MKDDTIRVLYIEDDEDDYILVRDLLSDITSPQYHVEWAKSYEEALQVIGSSHFDACLLDYRLGKHDGLELLNYMQHDVPHMPVILFTTSTDRNTDLRAMEAGAVDFLMKAEISSSLLERSIRYAAERKRMEDQLRASIAESKKKEEILLESKKQLRVLSAKLLSAQEEERRRIARELHDSIGSSLTAIKFSLENLQTDSPALEPIHFENLISLTQRTFEDTRKIIADLRPSILDDLGLLTTIASFCKSFQAIHKDIFIEQVIDVDEGHIPEDLKIVIYRLMQEAFHNIAKYSQAEFVELSLRKGAGTLDLIIEDNGEGFDLQAALSRNNHQSGLGLSSMRERTELSGGSFHLVSTMGEGTTIRASWNLTDRPGKAPLLNAADRGLAPEHLQPAADSLEGVIPEKAARLIHELEIHQVELKLQNEEFLRAKEDLEVLKEKDSRFFDLVPVGLLTLDQLGVIGEANFIAAEKLGADKSALVGRQLYSWIIPQDRDLLHLHLKSVFETGKRQTCTLRLKKGIDPECSVQLDSLVVQHQAGKNLCATAVTDVVSRTLPIRDEAATSLAGSDQYRVTE
jgi:signal transduction histidine kinase